MSKLQKNQDILAHARIPKNMREIVGFTIRPYRRRTILFFFVTFLGVACWNASTYAASQLINNLSQARTVTESAWWIVGIFAFFRIFDEVFWRIGEVIAMRTKPQMIERLRSELFSATLKKPHEHFVNTSSGRIAHWINQTTINISSLVNIVIWGVWGEILGMTMSTIFLITTHWLLALIFAVWLIVLFLYNSKRGKRLSRLVGLKSTEDSKAAGLVVDSMANNVSMRVFNARNHEVKTLGDIQKDILKRWYGEWGFATVTNAVKGISAAVVNVGAISIAVWLFARGDIEVGGLALFLAYFNSASTGLWNLAWNFDEYYRLSSTVQNALDGLSGKDEMTDDQVHEVPETTSLTLDNLTFYYPEQPAEVVLKSVSLKVASGEKIGIVGHSGAGKSTLVGLLLRFYEPTSGDVAINGESIYAKDPSFVRDLSSFGPQDTSMFNRTIRENVLYARPDATENELTDALQKAHALEFVEKLPKGLDTLVGERGVKLSGGQRQRIAIARAILRDAPLLILDEATSALDSVSEQAIQKALHDLMKGRTAVVIAHRLSTLKHLDRIIVLEKGRITEQGSHDQLLKMKDGVYADLWRRQKDGFIVE